MQKTRTHIKGHETTKTKSDEEFGIQTLRPRYRTGAVDLPYSQDDMKTRVVVDEFKQELIEWPDSQTEDMVMGHWFLEFNRYRIPEGLRVQETAGREGMKHPFQDTLPERLATQTRIERTSDDRVAGHRANRRERGYS